MYGMIMVAGLALIVGSSSYLTGCFGTETQAGEIKSGGADFILSATPQGLVEDMAQFYSINVVFSRAMVPLQALPEGDGSGPLKITPALKGKYRWLGTNTLTFIPQDTLTLASRYTVTIPAGTKAVDGTSLERDYTFSFETLRPKLLQSSIGDQATNVDIKTKIFLLYNQSLRSESMSNKISLRKSDYNEIVSAQIDFASKEEIKSYSDQNYVTGDMTNRLVVIRPTNSLLMGSKYRISVESGVKGTVGMLASDNRTEIDFSTYDKLLLRNTETPLTPTGAIKFYFTNRVDGDELKKHVHIEPAVEMIDAYGSWNAEYPAEVYFKFAPQTSYTVTIDGDTKDDFENELGQSQSISFQIGDYEPSVFFNTGEHGEHVIESYLSHDFNLAMINPTEVNINIGLLSQQDVIKAAKELFNKDMSFTDWGYRISETPNVTRNETVIYPVPLDKALKGKPSGFLLVEYYRPKNDYPQRALIQLTALAVTAKFSRVNNLIYTTSLKDGIPVKSYVELRDDAGNLTWNGYTDEKGFVKTPGWAEMGLKAGNYSEPRQWVFATLNAQTAYTNSYNNIPLYRFNVTQAWNVKVENTISAKLFTNQGLYRPGDKVYIKGLTRQISRGAIALWKNGSVKITISNYNNEELLNRTVDCNGMGSFDLECLIPETAKLGYYSITANVNGDQIGADGFQVQEFRPAEFEITVSPKKPEYVWNERLEATIDGHYLFGAPMSNAETRWTITTSKSNYTPPGFDEYFFGALYEYDSYSSNYSPMMAEGTAKLDSRGLLNLENKLTPQSMAETRELTIEATIQDKSHQSLSGRRTVLVHQGKYYLGLKPSATFQDITSPWNLTLIAAKTNGDRISASHTKVEIIRREWISVRQEGYDGEYQWRSEKKDAVESSFNVDVKKESTDKSYKFTKPGYYIVRASAQDDLNNTIASECYVYVTGDSYAGWEMKNEDAIDLVVQKKSYKVGETAKLLVKSPYDKCRAFVTVEREGVIWHATMKLKGNSAAIEIPITSEMVPNVYVSVILHQGRTAPPGNDPHGDLGKPAFKIGYTKLAIQSDENKLRVDVSSSQKKYTPQAWVETEISVKDKSGNGKESEVTVYVEDLGVLNLAGYKTPEPFELFYAPRDLGVTTAESRKFVLEQMLKKDLKQKGGIGGGGAEESEVFAGIPMRRDFKACVYWNASVKTDANGKAKVRFQVPDNLTTFKILAVAHTEDSKFGSGETKITVAKDFLLRSTLPRFGRIGDEMEAGVLAHNQSDKPGVAKIQMTLDGGRITDNAVKEITLAPGASEEVRFKFIITQAKKGMVTFAGTMNELTDAVEIRLPFEAPTFTETVALSGSDISNHQEKLIVPGDIYDHAGGITVSMASTAMTDLSASAQYLFEYPYGCLEQRTSRVLPILLFQDVVLAFNLPAFADGKKSMDAAIQEYLTVVASYQKYDGGFGYWPNSEYVNAYVSAYTMMALTKAKEKGYTVPQYAFDRGIDYLKTTVRNSKMDWYGLNYLHCTQALMLSVLADNGYYDASSAELLFQRREELPLYARTHLWKAIVKGKGQSAMAAELRRSLNNAIKLEATSAHFEEPNPAGMEWTFYSNVKTTAAVLQAFVEIEGETGWAEKVVKYLLAERKIGRWRTTQENTYVFWALGTYFKVYEKETPNFSAQVLLDGKSVLNEVYKGRSLKTTASTTGYIGLRRQAELPLDFNKTGVGRMYYTVRMQYAPKQVPKPRDEGIKVEKEFQDENGNVITNGNFSAGKLYRIKLTISSFQDRTHLVIDDPLPAGFEALNLDLATASLATPNITSRTSPWDYGGFNFKELRDSRVAIYSDYFSKGSKSFTYVVRATTLGKFQLPPTKAEGMYAPEVFGNTAGQTIVVQ